MKKTYKASSGFTLIELMVSVSIFMMVMTISMGSILGIFDANRKSRSLKTVMNSLQLTIDTISREMRYGKNYHCGSPGQDDVPNDCASEPKSYISFLSSEGDQITYKLDNGAIKKSVNGGSFIPVTGQDLVVQSLTFYVVGAPAGDMRQPKAIMLVKGYSGSNTRSRSDFALQSMVSQRTFDKL